MDSRGYANVSFDQVAVSGLDVLTGEGGIEKLFDVAAVTLSAEMLGSAAAAFDMTLEYLKTRKQFGQVIGGFQALGHRAASLYSEMELTRSCVEAALAALDQDREDVAELASLAKGKTSEFLHEMSSQLIQIHGGIGMTDEFDAGFYLKRARVVEAAFGNAAYHRDRFATASGF
jgi:alkylation response protein AidB-like acyl-CoA dehydrogenase